MDFQTPPWVCELMVGMIPNNCFSILEPTPGEGNLVFAIEKHNLNVYSPKDFWEVSDTYDAIVMNPPFSPMKIGYEILYKCMEMSNIIIALMPYLTIINSERRTAEIFNFGLKSIWHLPSSVFKGSRVQTCILNMQKGYKDITSFYLADKMKSL